MEDPDAVPVSEWYNPAESGFARESKMEDPDAVPVSEWYNPAESEFAQESKMKGEIIEHKDKAGQLPPLLKAIDLILADPAKIQRKSLARYRRSRAKYKGRFTDDKIADMLANKIISEYAKLAAASGGASALAGVVPGLGAAVAILGGGMADTALSMKFQIEMVMAIAVVYGYDITLEEHKRLCFLIAGLGANAIADAAGGKAKAIGTGAFTKLVLAKLKGSTLIAVKEVFKRIGITFTRKALVKAIPFGVGVVVGAGMGYGLTRYVGYKAKGFFKIHRKGTRPYRANGSDSAEEEQWNTKPTLSKRRASSRGRSKMKGEIIEHKDNAGQPPPLLKAIESSTKERDVMIELQDRCRGILVGLAVGNLLGIVCEGWGPKSIRRQWPGGLREIEARPGFPDDDDLAQAIVLAEACVGAETLDVNDLARRFWIWGEENGAGMGPATKRTLIKYGGNRPTRYLRNLAHQRRRDGQKLSNFQAREALSNFQVREPVGLPALAASRAAWEETLEKTGRRSAGNGAVMRCAPLAIRWRHDDASLVRNTAASAAVTHWDSRCVWSAVLVNLAIASFLQQPLGGEFRLVDRAEQAREEVGDALTAFGIDGPVPAAVVEALVAADVATPNDLDLDGWDMGYTLKAMQVALWCARRAQDFEEALIAVVNAGGDTDTNGAVAGAALGARFGLSAIPRRWRDRVAALRTGQEPMEVWADRLMA